MPLPKGEKVPTDEMVKLLRVYLSSSDTENALSLCLDDGFEECFRTCSWDLIPLIVEYLNDDTLKKNRKLFNCCEELVNQIAEKSPPEEILLVFIDEAERLVDIKLISLLMPMQKTLLRLDSKLEVSVEWCLNSIFRHIRSLPIPEERSLEAEERKLLDCDPCVQRIRSLYTAIIPFYEPFIEKVTDSNSPLNVKKKIELRNAILRFNFRVLGRPLVFMDLESNFNTKSSFSFICEKLMNNIAQLSKNLLHFLEEGDLNNLNKDISSSNTDLETGSQQSSDTFSTDDRYSPVSLGVFYYLLFVEKMNLESIPFVYSPLYILEKCIYLSVIFMKSSITIIQRKGLLLANAALGRIADECVAQYILESYIYAHFIEGLFMIAVFCNERDNRAYSIKLIKVFFNKFNLQGRYLLLMKMVKIADHSGLIGYLATLYKNLLNEIISNPTSEQTHFFTVGRILSLLDKFCDLPNKAASDLVELSDQVISSLNLIRFLVIRDKNNRSGIWDHIDKLKKDYFTPLREGISLSRAHYKLKLHDIEEERKTNKTEKSIVSITIGNQALPNLPIEGKISVINSALNSFDLIESLICRINECIEVGRL